MCECKVWLTVIFVKSAKSVNICQKLVNIWWVWPTSGQHLANVYFFWNANKENYDESARPPESAGTLRNSKNLSAEIIMFLRIYVERIANNCVISYFGTVQNCVFSSLPSFPFCSEWPRARGRPPAELNRKSCVNQFNVKVKSLWKCLYKCLMLAMN